MLMPVLAASIMLEAAAVMPVVAACCRIPQEALHASTVSARQLRFVSEMSNMRGHGRSQPAKWAELL